MNNSTKVQQCKNRLGDLQLNLLNNPYNLVMEGNMRKLFTELKEMLCFKADNPNHAIEIQMQATAFLIDWISRGELGSKIREDELGVTRKFHNSPMHDFEVHFNRLLSTIVSNIGNTNIVYYTKTEDDILTAASLDQEISSNKEYRNGKKRVKIQVPDKHPSKRQADSSSSQRVVHIYKNIETTVSKRSIELLLLYAESFQNYELITKALTIHGIDHPDWRVRMNCLITASALLDQRPQLIHENNNHFLLLLEAIIIRIKDSADSVRKQANKTLEELVETHFTKLQKLAFWMNPKQRDDLLIYLDEWEKTQMRLEEEHGGVDNNLKGTEEEKLEHPTEREIEILNEKGDPTDYLLIEDPSWAMAPNGLSFGVIPRDVMNAAELHNHLGTRVTALREMEKILGQDDNFEHILNYGSLFCRYLSIILEDHSKEILKSVFKILKKILAIPGFGNKVNFQRVLIAIINHVFKHKDVSVRQGAQTVVKDVMLTMKIRTYISTITESMMAQEWIVREECLRAIIIGILETNDPQYEDIDYVNLVAALSRCITDEKPKIRYITTEVIAVLCAYGNKNALLELLYQTIKKETYYALCDRLDDAQLPYLNGLGQVEFPYLMTERSQSIKKVMKMDKKFSERLLSAHESLPDIHKGRPLAGEPFDKGYMSNKETESSKILRFNDAFKYIKPLPTHSRTDREQATSTFRGSLGANWKEQLVKLSDEDKIQESIAQFKEHKYPELEENKKTLKDLIKEKNSKMIELMDDQEMRESVYKLFPTPHELKERNEQLNKSISEQEEEEEESENEEEKKKEFCNAIMRKLLDQGDKVPFTIELMPSKNPTQEFNSAVQVIEESQDVEALKNSFTTLRKIVVFHTDLLKSSPFILTSVVGRLKRYISSDSNHLLSQHALKTLSDIINSMPIQMKKYFEEFVKLILTKYMNSHDKLHHIAQKQPEKEEEEQKDYESNQRDDQKSSDDNKESNDLTPGEEGKDSRVNILTPKERKSYLSIQKECLASYLTLIESCGSTKSFDSGLELLIQMVENILSAAHT
ncbi:unnamed protein product [Moneuplotes crassus]|uniref:TOG domain-containing protein n=1 Tax=Euplotes crassus TaxID=5936 RepID=A0AAD2DCX1_EUPCR|nr:unnamed protein product [Moneuplotes crassus]